VKFEPGTKPLVVAQLTAALRQVCEALRVSVYFYLPEN
jgi:hypothetical protein